jgi:hypothetical protein
MFIKKLILTENQLLSLVDNLKDGQPARELFEHPNATEKVLLKILNEGKCRESDEYLDLLEHPNATEKVLLEGLKVEIDPNFNPLMFAYSVVANSNATEKVLLKAVEKSQDKFQVGIFEKIVTHSNATENVLSNIVDALDFLEDEEGANLIMSQPGCSIELAIRLKEKMC